MSRSGITDRRIAEDVLARLATIPRFKTRCHLPLFCLVIAFLLHIDPTLDILKKKSFSRFFTGANVWSATVLLTKCRMKVPEANLMSDRRRGGGKSRMAMEGSDRWDIKLFLCCCVDAGILYIFQMSNPTERCPQKTAGHIRSKDKVWLKGINLLAWLAVIALMPYCLIQA